MSDDPGEAICDALVAYVNQTQATEPFALTFSAENPEDIQAELEREHADLKVFFSPFGETEEKIGRGGHVLEVFEITMLVVRRLDANANRKQLNGLVYEIRRRIRQSREKMAGATWSAGETVVKSDPKQISESIQFTSVSRLRYTRTGAW